MSNRVSVIQLSSSHDVADNLQRVASLLAQVEAELVVLPEVFAQFASNDQQRFQAAESFGQGPIQDFLAHQAQRHSIWLLAGSVLLKTNINDKLAASSLLYDANGKCVARYDKIHLFDASVEAGGVSYRESRYTVAGDQVVVVNTPVARIGLSICYDLRFPELYRTMQASGVELICVPSAFTHPTGRAHWHSLLRARAIENMCYIVAANQSVQEPKSRRCYGHSMIVDPWGQVLCQQVAGEGIITATVNLAELYAMRAEFPVLQHRKLY